MTFSSASKRFFPTTLPQPLLLPEHQQLLQPARVALAALALVVPALVAPEAALSARPMGAPSRAPQQDSPTARKAGAVASAAAAAQDPMLLGGLPWKGWDACLTMVDGSCREMT